MPEETTIENPVKPAPAATADLSKNIEQTAERKPDETIKAVRVFENYYRCNWRIHEKSATSFWLATPTITKSRLLRATMTSEGLLIEDVTLN